jgi:endonuclease III
LLQNLVPTLELALDRHLPGWRDLVRDLAQVPKVEARRDGWRPNDAEAVQALLLSYLSAMTDWSRIQGALPHILDAMRDWTPAHVASLSRKDLARLHRWFLEHRLGSVLLRQQLRWLPAAASILERMSIAAGSVDAFIERAQEAGKTIELLTSKESEWKLPGVGVALAAEFLKNMGHDDFKPDRHMLRMLGSHRLNVVGNPTQLEVRRWGLQLAREMNMPAAQLDQMLWLYCARGYAAVCNARPRCGECPFAPTCRFPTSSRSS